MLLALILTQAVVTFTTVAAGTSSDIDMPRQVVVRTPEQWRHLWRAHNPQEPTPAIDFARQVVVGVFLGTRSTAGFSVTVTAVKTEDSRTVVEYVERRPAADDLVAQVITSSFHLVTIPADVRSVEFRKVGP